MRYFLSIFLKVKQQNRFSKGNQKNCFVGKTIFTLDWKTIIFTFENHFFFVSSFNKTKKIISLLFSSVNILYTYGELNFTHHNTYFDHLFLMKLHCCVKHILIPLCFSFANFYNFFIFIIYFRSFVVGVNNPVRVHSVPV